MHISRVMFIAAVLLMTTVMLFAGGGQEEPAATTTPATNSLGSNRVEIDTNWGVSWQFLEGEIEFTMWAPTTGWLSIGFNPSRAMRDAAYILAYVDNGNVSIREDFGTGNTAHRADTSLGGTEQVRATAFKEEEGTTYITFVLPLDSGDEHDVVFTPGETYTLLAAYSGNGSKNFTAPHRARKALQITL